MKTIVILAIVGLALGFPGTYFLFSITLTTLISQLISKILVTLTDFENEMVNTMPKLKWQLNC